MPTDVRVLVDQIWLGDRREDAVAASYTAEDLVVVQRDIGSIVQYTMEMGGDVELVQLSLKAPPWEPMRSSRRGSWRGRISLLCEAMPSRRGGSVTKTGRRARERGQPASDGEPARWSSPDRAATAGAVAAALLTFEG